ncbi:hypothetical protein RSAG8_11999, partial [Rhizoctonia solani AG-8 WAC10335]
MKQWPGSWREQVQHPLKGKASVRNTFGQARMIKVKWTEGKRSAQLELNHSVDVRARNRCRG